MAATKARVGYTHEDEARVAATSGLLAPHIGAVTNKIYHDLLANPETAAPFRDATGAIDREQLAMQREGFVEWLRAAIGAPLDALTAEYLAVVGHEHVRREHAERTKARYLLTTISRVQALFVAILADSISDSKDLGACAGAWCKRLMIHLDLLLAVYGSTESTAHWY